MSMTDLEREQQTRIEQLEACAKSALRREDLEPLRKALNPAPPPSGKAEGRKPNPGGKPCAEEEDCDHEPCCFDEAKPPDPEDLPHPGTGRLLSASPVKPPEPAKCETCKGAGGFDNGLEACVCGSCRGSGLANPPPPPEPAPEEEMVHPMHFNAALRTIADLRARLAAAQTEVGKLERRENLLENQLQAATERAEKLQSDFTRLQGRYEDASKSANRYAAACFELRRERDAAIKAKEEAERAIRSVTCAGCRTQIDPLGADKAPPCCYRARAFLKEGGK